MRFFFAEFLRMGNQRFILYNRFCGTCGKLLKGFDKPLRAKVSQLVVQRPAGVFCGDRARKLIQHITRIETNIHLHDGYTRLGIASPQRTLNRGRTAPARKQRAVNVNAAQAWNIKYGFWQKEAIGHDDHNICAQVRDELLVFLRT